MQTTPSAMYVLPARAPGFARGWWARTGAVGFSTTFAGAIPEKASSVNGVVYAVSKEELEATNQREQGYTPTDITDTVQILSGRYKPADKVWIYVNKFREGERQQSLPSPPVSHRAIVCRYLPDWLSSDRTGFPGSRGLRP